MENGLSVRVDGDMVKRVLGVLGIDTSAMLEILLKLQRDEYQEVLESRGKMACAGIDMMDKKVRIVIWPAGNEERRIRLEVDSFRLAVAVLHNHSVGFFVVDSMPDPIGVRDLTSGFQPSNDYWFAIHSRVPGGVDFGGEMSPHTVRIDRHNLLHRMLDEGLIKEYSFALSDSGKTSSFSVDGSPPGYEDAELYCLVAKMYEAGHRSARSVQFVPQGE